MCGIAGFVLSKEVEDGASILRRMTAAIVHRGPDDEGLLETRTKNNRYCVGLGHRRLSIIDLKTCHQPMGNEDGSVQIVFNGEIYNFQELRNDLVSLGHRFVTESDTETIVHAYEEFGEECVERLRGMFAFAIWDSTRERLFLARDRFGKKPLFYHEQGGDLLFASEIKSLLAYPNFHSEVNYDAVWDYLSYRYVPGPATLFTGVRKLPPGSIGIWEKGVLQEHCYFTPPDRQPWVVRSLPSDPVGAFLDLLDESVKIRMVSDVPFGAFLSGGIDSSAIVGLMARHSAIPIKTFSVGFAESEYSELGHAAVIARQFGTEHNELTISQDHLMEELPALVRYRDAPVSEPSDIPIYLLSKEAGRTVKMVLTGEGSDEFLGGYPKHVFERYTAGYQLLPGTLRHRLFEPLVHALPYRFRRIKTAIVNMGLEDRQDRMARWFGALSGKERDELVAFRPTAGRQRGVQFDTPKENSVLRRILYFDQVSWLPDNLLERGDRMTMAASIEARMPFMDHELAAYVSSLPDTFRVRGRQTKWILRAALKRMLPKTILERPKVGFRVPVNDWFRGTMRDYLNDHLSGTGSQTARYYNRDVLNRLLKEHFTGRQNHEKLLWTLLNLEIWHRQYIATG
jgi:asparagine synthase (glutamine-hydrolysing)